jgi:outer membrane protein W
MKKLTLTLAIVAVAFMAQAQRLSLGPTAGFGHSWITNMPGDGKFNPSWNVGATFVYSSMSHWGIGLDAKYSAEGVKKETSLGTYEVNANYLRIPIKGYYFFNEYGNPVRPKIFLGPSLGFLIGDDDSKNAFKGFDFGLLGGAGINFRIADRTWLNTDITYTHGFSNISDVSGATYRNRNIQLNIGVAFGLGGTTTSTTTTR